MKLPTWIPMVARPSNREWAETWDAMSENERRWSFLVDISMVFAFVFFLVLVSIW